MVFVMTGAIEFSEILYQRSVLSDAPPEITGAGS